MRLTMAQALVRFLAAQYAERDGVEQRFIEGCFGIFGQGNVAGVGEAVFERPDLLTYSQARNEQAMVHAAVGYARMRNRLSTMACTSSVGPGATNMVTGAALATINRLPVLLLPGDVFAARAVDPVLQQLEVPWRGDASVNDAFKPVSRFWDRITRPEQLMPSALQAMRVLTNPAETGAVTLALPQDVQAEAYEYPADFFERRGWGGPRAQPASPPLHPPAAMIYPPDRPTIIAAGGVLHFPAPAPIPPPPRLTLTARLNKEWDREVDRLYHLGHRPLPAQSEVIGAVNDAAAPRDVVVCAAGSMPGDLHKLWRSRDPKQYHVEYGYSCMGYEIAGALGAKMAAPDREVFSLVGDGSYLMLNSEIVTALQEGIKLVIVLVDNHGFNSIGSLSRSLGTDGFGTQYRFRKNGSLGLDSDNPAGAVLPIDLTANAASLGAVAVRAKTIEDLRPALSCAKRSDRTSLICIEAARYEAVPSYESWWDVPVSEVASVDAVKAAREGYEALKKKERRYL